MDRLPITGTPFPSGLSFIDPDLLEPVSGGAVGPAARLAEACLRLGASFAFVPAEAAWAAEAIDALAGEGVAPVAVLSGPLWPLLGERGIAEGLRSTLTHPEEFGPDLDLRLDTLVTDVARVAGLGARAIVLAEDLAGSQGPLVAPDFAIGELLPRYERVVRAARSLGMPAVFHSDGDLRALLPAIARAGFVAVHTGGGLGIDAFERLFWAARDAGLAVVGGLVTDDLANPVRAEALGSRIGVLAQAGGLFVADDGGITTAEEVASLVTALAAARAA